MNLQQIIKENEKRFYGKFYNELLDLIEEENYLATGVKSKKHFSGDCNINKIFELIIQFNKDSQLRLISAFKEIIEKADSIAFEELGLSKKGEINDMLRELLKIYKKFLLSSLTQKDNKLK
jgi:hypothetical protein